MFGVNLAVTLKVQFFLVFFGPSILGLLVLVCACLFSRRLMWLGVAGLVACILHLVSVALIWGAVGFGESTSGYNSEARSFHLLVTVCGFVVIGLLTSSKLAYIAYSQARTKQHE